MTNKTAADIKRVVKALPHDVKIRGVERNGGVFVFDILFTHRRRKYAIPIEVSISSWESLRDELPKIVEQAIEFAREDVDDN